MLLGLKAVLAGLQINVTDNWEKNVKERRGKKQLKTRRAAVLWSKTSASRGAALSGLATSAWHLRTLDMRNTNCMVCLHFTGLVPPQKRLASLFACKTLCSSTLVKLRKTNRTIGLSVTLDRKLEYILWRKTDNKTRTDSVMLTRQQGHQISYNVKAKA